MPKVALAYSGTLDTAICVHYMRRVRGLKVYTFSANLGQSQELRALFEKALELGATAAHIADLREKFVKDFVFPCVRAQAVYEGGYHLFSAISRPLILEELVRIAREEGCEYIAHGSRGIGNDIVRFQNGLRLLAPELKITVPLQDLKLRSLGQDIEYAKKHHIKVDLPSRAEYNMEENIWGVNIQIPQEEEGWPEPAANTYVRTVPLTATPPTAEVIDLEFEAGTPVKIGGVPKPPVQLIEDLNMIGGRCGIGRTDVIENRIAGLKTREIYEAPAAEILIRAHQALEALILDKETLHFKPLLSQKYAGMAYEGTWFSPLRRSLDDFFIRINKKITGRVVLSLLRGTITITDLSSPHSLFSHHGRK
jgi:argininosuccinate synthase